MGFNKTHEDFSRGHARQSSDRSFAVVAAVFFLAVGAWPVVRGASPRAWALALGALFAVVALVRPRLVRGLNAAWFRFGLLLARIVNPVALGVLYFAVMAPAGLLMRLAGKDPLRLRPDPLAASYWIERKPPGPEPESMKEQF